jgi:hypothetical protein
MSMVKNKLDSMGLAHLPTVDEYVEGLDGVERLRLNSFLCEVGFLNAYLLGVYIREGEEAARSALRAEV